MNQQEFRQTMQQHNLILSDRQMEQFADYLVLLVEWNKNINLTAITEPEEVYAKHFYDSVLPGIQLGLTNERFCDVGAGAGFPSIPLKIVFPQLSITILEPLQKRCVFLAELVAKLGLEDVTIVSGRAEDYAKDHRESFDVVSARAVANLSMLSELCIPLVKQKGIFLAMKGSSGREEQKQAQNAVSVLGCQIESIEEVQVGEHTHINLVYRKTKVTPKQYPRMFAKIKKSPL